MDAKPGWENKVHDGDFDHNVPDVHKSKADDKYHFRGTEFKNYEK